MILAIVLQNLASAVKEDERIVDLIARTLRVTHTDCNADFLRQLAYSLHLGAIESEGIGLEALANRIT